MPGETTLDRIDLGILAAMQKDARLSNKEVAAFVGLAPSSCHERIKRLRATGVIRAARTEIDPRAIGIGLQALIAIRLVRHDRASVEAIRAHLLELDEVIALFHTSGSTDFLAQVAVRNIDHLRDLTVDELTARPEVAQLETSILFDQVQKGALPIYR